MITALIIYGVLSLAACAWVLAWGYRNAKEGKRP